MIASSIRAAMLAALAAPLFAGCGAPPPNGEDVAPAAYCESKKICADVDLQQCCMSGCGNGMDVPCDKLQLIPPPAEQLLRTRCVLEAARDRTLGQYRIGHTVVTGQDGGATNTTIVSFGDGFVSAQDDVFSSTGLDQHPAVRRALKPKSFFDDCLASSDDLKLFACVLDMTESAAVAGPICPP